MTAAREDVAVARVLLLLLALSLAACPPTPELGPRIASFEAYDPTGEPVGHAYLFTGMEDPNLLIEETEIRDEKGRAVISVTSHLSTNETTRFHSRLRHQGSVETFEVEVSAELTHWKKKKGLAIFRAEIEEEGPVLLAWSLGFGPSSSVALWHHLAPLLSAGKTGDQELPVVSVQRGRLCDLFVSHRETREAVVDGAARETHRFFVSTRASGHTVWVDAEDGSLLSVDNLLGEGFFGATMVKDGFEPPEREVEPLPPFMTEEELTIETDDAVLSGTLTLPRERDGPLPAVILIHGSGPMDRDESPFMVFRHLAHDLGERGFAVLRYDKRGVGESRILHEDRDVTLWALARDVRAWLDVIAGRPEIDPERIALAGHSEGGYIGPLVASRDPRVAGVVMLAGPVDPLLDILREQAVLVGEAHRMTEAEIDEIARQVSAFQRRVESEATMREETISREVFEQIAWLRSHALHDAEAVLRDLEIPVLAIFADGDIQVPIEQAHKMRALAREKAPGMIEAEILDGLDHVLMDNRDGRHGLGLLQDPDRRLDERVPKLMADWLRR